MTPRRALAEALPVAVPQQSIKPGALFAGYHLVDELGRGGMGLVFSACHAGTDRLVALKIPPGGADAELLARFRAEAEAMSALDHPGIMSVYEVGEAGGVPFFTMRLAEGGSLAGQITRFRTDPRGAAALLAKVADAVQHAHERGLLHRDLKPSNILFTAPDEPLVADFGLARWLRRDGGLTMSGALLGTPGYLAPELLGKAEATIASDVFSLGAVLYHMLCGRPPFVGESVAATLAQVVESVPPGPRSLNPALPRDLEAIVLRSLDRDPARRYGSAREFAADLRRFLAGEPVVARAASPLEVTWRWCRRRPALATLIALLAAVTAAAFVMIDAARRSEIAARSHLTEALDRAELDRAEDIFRAGDSAGALAPLVRIIRREPAHPSAGPRLASALWHGDFALPLPPPLAAGGEVLMMKFLRDGNTLLACTHKGAATWDAANGRRLLEFERSDERLFIATISPDERTLAEWDPAPGKYLRLLDVATGHLCVPPIPHKDWLVALEFSPDSSRCVIARWDSAVGILDSRTGAQLGEPLGNRQGLTNALYSPDGETIAANGEATVQFWDAHTRKVLRESPPLDRFVRLLRFSPDGHWLAAASLTGTVRLLATDDDGRADGLPMRHASKIRTMAFSADGRRLLTASEDHTARVWAVPSGEPLTPPLQHRDLLTFAKFSPDGTRVVTGSLDNTARVWDAATGRSLSQPLRHLETVRDAVFSPDGTTLYTGGSDGFVQRWDLRAGAETGAAFVGKLAEFSADGKRVIATTRKNFARDTAAFRPLAAAAEFRDEMRRAHISADGRRAAIIDAQGAAVVIPLDGAVGEKPIAILEGQPVNEIALSPDGTKLAIASANKTARVWDAVTGAAVTPVLAHPEPVGIVHFSPDGRTVLTGTYSPRDVGTGLDAARLWDATTGQPLGAAMPHGDDLYSAEFSPDGTLVATASDDNTARVWDARTGAPISPPLRHARTVVRAVFSPDSRRVATASWDGTARVWDVHTGAQLTRALTHEDHASDVCFSPDGRRIATASRDKTVRVWDAASGEPLTEPLPRTAPLEHLCFHPDGQRLLVSGTDSVTCIWDVPDFSAPPPAWLVELADAISHAEPPTSSVEASAALAQYERSRRQATAVVGTDAYSQLAKRLFSGSGAGAAKR